MLFQNSFHTDENQQSSNSDTSTEIVITKEVGIQCNIRGNCSSLRKSFSHVIEIGAKDNEEVDHDVSASEMLSIRNIRSMYSSHKPVKGFPKSRDTSSKQNHPISTPKRSHERNKSHLIDGLRINTGQPCERYFVNEPDPFKKAKKGKKYDDTRIKGNEASNEIRNIRNSSINMISPATTSLDTEKKISPKKRVSLKRCHGNRLADDSSTTEEKGSSSIVETVKKAKMGKRTTVDTPRRSTRQKKTPSKKFSMTINVIMKPTKSRHFVTKKILDKGNFNIQTPQPSATNKKGASRSFHGLEVKKKTFMNTSLDATYRVRRLYSPTEWLNSKESTTFAAMRTSSNE